jgi:hypothetical protein
MGTFELCAQLGLDPVGDHVKVCNTALERLRALGKPLVAVDIEMLVHGTMHQCNDRTQVVRSTGPAEQRDPASAWTLAERLDDPVGRRLCLLAQALAEGFSVLLRLHQKSLGLRGRPIASGSEAPLKVVARKP